MLLYHGTDEENLKLILQNPVVNEYGLWCSNDRQIAEYYGTNILKISMSERDMVREGVEVYPLASGKRIEAEDCDFTEPLELRIPDGVRISIEGYTI